MDIFWNHTVNYAANSTRKPPKAERELNLVSCSLLSDSDQKKTVTCVKDSNVPDVSLQGDCSYFLSSSKQCLHYAWHYQRFTALCHSIKQL